jgi:hypothetical protein
VKIAIITGLFAKRDMDIYACQYVFYFIVLPITVFKKSN